MKMPTEAAHVEVTNKFGYCIHVGKLSAIAVTALLVSCTEKSTPWVSPPNGQWISLFNGKNLDGWVVKIAGHDLNDNYGNTFRVVDGVLKVAYDQYQQFGTQFGSLFYREKYASYWLRVEYRFVGEPAPGAPSWAWRDSGMQLHSQSPESMQKDQQFPVSIEFNFIGGGFFRSRPTGNVCTTGTHVIVNQQLLTEKCATTSKLTTRGEQWVTAVAEVHGDASITHIVNGEVVAEYSQPTLDSNDTDAQRLRAQGASARLQDGYISLQSNGQPLEVRKIEILPL
jgi:hypothetical protein